MRIIETCPVCGHDLVDLVLTSYPPIPQKKCFNCGWSWTGEREKEEVVRVPFSTPTQFSDACEHCSNNPKNGGSGICNCTLGLPKVTC